KRVSVWAVAAVTFANGGDNIGVYVPVFVSVSWGAVLAYCIVFLVLVAVLVFLASGLAPENLLQKPWNDGNTFSFQQCSSAWASSSSSAAEPSDCKQRPHHGIS